jgi:hypothetical protein
MAKNRKRFSQSSSESNLSRIISIPVDYDIHLRFLLATGSSRLSVFGPKPYLEAVYDKNLTISGYVFAKWS